jgi:hypothetical protein
MPKRKPKTKSQRKEAMGEVMSEFKRGKLHSGSPRGPKVKTRAQAIAIGMNESGQSDQPRAARKKGRARSEP